MNVDTASKNRKSTLAQNLKTHVINFECDNDGWNLLTQYFRLRSAVFVKGKHWNLFNDQDHELDEYDKETSRYVLVNRLDTGEIVAGARLSPTEDPSFQSPIPGDAASFMIKDACNGLLEGLPRNLCFHGPPEDQHIWELTRVVALDSASTQALFERATAYLRSLKVTHCLALGSPAIMRVARLYGCDPVAIGPVVSNQNGEFLAFQCRVNPAPG